MKTLMLIFGLGFVLITIALRLPERLNQAEVYVPWDVSAYNPDGTHRPLTVGDIMAVMSPEGEWLPRDQWQKVLDEGNYNRTTTSHEWTPPDLPKPSMVSTIPATE